MTANKRNRETVSVEAEVMAAVIHVERNGKFPQQLPKRTESATRLKGCYMGNTVDILNGKQ